MKNYTITVNGETYTITIEEGAVSDIVAVSAAPVATPAVPATPAATPAPATAPAGAAGSVNISASVPGKVIAVRAAAGQAAKKGDVILVLEAMKIENGIVVPQGGTIASVNASTGDSVKSGTVLAALN